MTDLVDDSPVLRAPPELTAPQIRAAAMLASGMKAAAICEELGVSSHALRSWRRLEPFDRYWRALADGAAARAVSRLEAGTEHAAERLLELVDSPDPMVAEKAARGVLDRAGVGPESKVLITNEPKNEGELIARMTEVAREFDAFLVHDLPTLQEAAAHFGAAIVWDATPKRLLPAPSEKPAIDLTPQPDAPAPTGNVANEDPIVEVLDAPEPDDLPLIDTEEARRIVLERREREIGPGPYRGPGSKSGRPY